METLRKAAAVTCVSRRRDQQSMGGTAPGTDPTEAINSCLTKQQRQHNRAETSSSAISAEPRADVHPQRNESRHELTPFRKIRSTWSQTSM